MLKLFKNILTQNIREEEDTATVEDELQLATCMLLLEVAQADGTIQPQEELQIQTIIRKRFSLSDADSDKLIEKARELQTESLDIYPVATLINRHWPTEEKCRLLENIWQIVYADGILEQHEDHLMHKLGTLLQLSHRQLIDAKLQAKQAIR
ncbi:MAG TPA: TerB family tellurite resistance protein [Proteobacteria bacterium]|nr:TerB family tellurite resistance protein [Pseudomonadota bacterium]